MPDQPHSQQSADNPRDSVAGPSASRPCPSADKPHRGWGGRRPGAGAPKGNLNALKHGRRSAQMAELGRLIASDPRLCANLLGLAIRTDARRKRADKLVAERFAQLLRHAEDIARGRRSPGPFAGYLDVRGADEEIDRIARGVRKD